MSGRRDGTRSQKKRRLGIHETTLENDIRYRGPLSPTHFKVLGWLCIVLAQVAMIIRLGGYADASVAASTASLLSVLDNADGLALAFLLIVNFAQLLNAHDGYRIQLLINGTAMAGVCGLYYLIFYRYLVGGLAAFLVQPSEALPAVKKVVGLFLPYGFFSFNIFVDLFLCTLTMIFLNYNPGRVFVGKARICFRLLALLPTAYEVGCMLLKLRAARGLLQIPVWAFPLLTVKPPMTFVLFVVLALFVKTRELRFRRHGKTHEEYKAFLKTRRNAWNFSVFLAIMLVLFSVLDVAVLLGLSLTDVKQTITAHHQQALMEAASEADQTAQGDLEAALEQMRQALEQDAAVPMDAVANSEAADAANPAEDQLSKELLMASLDSSIRMAVAVGFGGSIYLIFLAPVVLLFSYTRKPKNRLVDALIPAAGVFLSLLVYIEGIHQLLGHLPIQKVNLHEMIDTAKMYMSMFK